ncbi:membrane protein [Isoptericola sp. CG 20/1183]|uniref:Membrane protein n=1 Tax=Isoptericola halotolerans TaxID=300560 RepID=A0ABX5EHQ2_9MICO|nr:MULTISPECIES: YihY/virulence factor BrkB family protein [Isoptericola]PRZ07734.1 membrane protein [Isoptericola halotolerans]PRZ07907.1 membrane protein [Isoptericola sp. CG 20/1183]
MPDEPERLTEKIARWTEWLQDRREVRAVRWYLAQRGNQLSGGIAYSALFSLGAGLTIGFSVFSAVLGNRPELSEAVFEQIDSWVPGLLKDSPDDAGLVSPDELVRTTAWSWTTVVASIVFLWTAIGVMAALRHSVRSLFEAPVVGVSPVLSKVWQLLGFVILGLMLLASAVASIVSQTVNNQITRWLGDSAVLGWVLSAGTFAVGLVLDTLLVYLVIRVVARVRTRHGRDMLIGCLATGLVASGLRWVGTSAITASAERNVILASIVTVGALLILVNFVARVLLIACAWMYDPPRLEEIARAEETVAWMRRQAEIERVVRRGPGSGRPYSPVVRGVRRGLYDY